MTYRMLGAIAAMTVALAACDRSAASSPHVAAARLLRVDDGDGSARASAMDAFRAVGHWEHVRGRFDGRSNGTSTRSFHAHDALQMLFRGSAVRLYAVTGPTSGLAIVSIDDEPPQTVDFYTPRKRTNRVVWQRAGLSASDHLLTIVVVGQHDPQSGGNYVNVDGAEIEGARGG